MTKHIAYGLLGAAFVVIMPIFWAQACVKIAVFAWSMGLVRTEFATNFGSALLLFPWVLIAGAALSYIVSLARADISQRS